MTCLICKTGVMKDGFTNVVLSKGSATVVFKNVPARICDDCGEYWLDEAVADDLYRRSNQMFESGQELAVSSFAVA
jgi:YgiT-type zinc finger domain-containing protein